ncbi:MAG: hypothetical protein GXP33_04900, partial [Spirochaetes bacterium]|nr:hypothetical protein [Spirochaetota bacterium]
MVKRKFIIIISGIVLVLLLSVAVIYLVKNEDNKNTINELLIKADGSLSSGYYNKAEGFLNAASKKAESSNQFIKILNKAFLIAVTNENFNFFYRMTERAYEKIKDNGKITLLTAYGRIKTGNISSAYEILTKSGFKSVRLREIKKSLLDELSVRYH